MGKKVSEGKRRRLDALADPAGVFSAIAMDHRESLRQAIANARGMANESVSSEELTEFKVAVTRILSPYASAILLDPDYALPALGEVAQGTGLLLTYEKDSYKSVIPGQIPELSPRWSVRRLADLGAHGIKLLVRYAPSDPPDINEEKRALVERVGAECAALEIPFFLEFVGNSGLGADSELD